jgi:hypothetical protein
MSIQLIPQKTQLEINLAAIDAPLVLVENCVKTAIHNLNDSFSKFWNLPDDQIEEIMNSQGIEKLQSIFEAHFRYANEFNTLLENRGIDQPRAITSKPREITVDQNGIISLVPLPTPEPQPSSEEPIIGETTTEETN